MSSHREAPEISKDPSADNTDVYAFVSPDAPDTVTLIANYVPFELPYGGPNFYEFSDAVRYEIHVSNSGQALPDITYEFRFTTRVRSRRSFLYNTGRIHHPSDNTWDRPQTFTVTRRTRNGNSTVLGQDLFCPPVNIGPHSTPNYPALAAQTYYDLGNKRKVFAGQRADAFHVDLGSVFDFGVLRPFQSVYAVPPILQNMPGVNGLRALNVHTIALQIPIRDLTADGSRPTDPLAADSTIGVWASASRAAGQFFDQAIGRFRPYGSWQQVSRLGNPLVNEVLIPMAEKDYWNAESPKDDSQFVEYVNHPELAALISKVWYPAAFPNLARYVTSGRPRADLAAILMTGIPAGIVPGFQNYTGATIADMLRLNVAVKPAIPGHENPIGLLAGDPAGFPNGRRVIDDTTAIELRAVAGVTLPLVDHSYQPDAAAGALNDGTENDNTPYGSPLLTAFPYLSNPNSGYATQPGKPGGNPS